MVDFLTGKDWEDSDDDDDDNNNNINIMINHQVEEEEDEDQWIHGESHTNYYDYYDDEVPITPPPEAEERLDFESLRLLLPQMEEEPTATISDIATAIVDAPYYDLEDDDDDDDDGSDYYFSLPSESAISTKIIAMEALGEDEEVTTVFEAQHQEDTMHVLETLNTTEDVMVQQENTDVEVAIAMEDATEDAQASMSIDEISVSEDCPTASLGSIWVPDPKHGMVRRSARLRVRG